MTAELNDTTKEDDPTIADAVALWRRLHPDWVVTDRQTGRPRISSAAFQNYRGRNALSICITCDAPDGYSAENYVAAHEGYGVAELTAGLARSAGQGVVRVPEEGEIGHGHLVGEKPGSVKKRLATDAAILIAPAVR